MKIKSRMVQKVFNKGTFHSTSWTFNYVQFEIYPFWKKKKKNGIEDEKSILFEQ